jgi:hypothetical protein
MTGYVQEKESRLDLRDGLPTVVILNGISPALKFDILIAWNEFD